MRNLLKPVEGDRGDPDPEVRRLVAAARRSRTDYLDAVVSLCTARLLMPVMAPQDRLSPTPTAPQPSHPSAGSAGDQAHEMAPEVNELGAVVLTHPDGTTALLCFTGADAMGEWDARARPVPGHLDDLAATVDEAGAQVLLIDVAGPVPMVIGPDLIAQLSAGRRLVKLDDGGYGWMSVAR